MAKRLGVVVIHGIGQQKDGFARPLIDRVTTGLGTAASSVVFQPVLWAGVIDDDERQLLANASRENRLDWLELRRFVISFLGDAVAYQRVPEGQQKRDIYRAIHKVVAEGMGELRRKLEVDAPLVVIAHSLGGHIMSNYLWDLQHPNEATAVQPDNAFERAETLAAMITFGCNIPLFSLAFNRMVPITFPAPNVARCFPGRSAAQISAATRWLNLFDRDDVLGYPLKPLSPEYASAVSEDREVNAGNALTSWNPASHNGYWTDNDVVDPIVETLRGLLNLIDD